MTQYPTIADGERLKLDALESLEARRDLYILRGRRALLHALCYRGDASADDVRAGVELPSDISPKCFGAVPGPLVAAGIIEPDGFVKSRRPEAHARHVQCWRLADRAAALRWLTANPNQPDPLPSNPTLFDVKKYVLDATTPSTFA